MKEIFLTLMEKITEEVNEIRMVDSNRGQLGEEVPPLSYPCVLTGLDLSDFSDLAGNGQEGDLDIELKVAFKKFERTHNLVSPEWRAKGLEHFDVLKKLHKTLIKIEGDNFSKLKRESWKQDKRSDLLVFTLVYSTLYEDIPESPYVQTGQEPDLCVHINGQTIQAE